MKEATMGGACSLYGWTNIYRILMGKPLQKQYLEDRGGGGDLRIRLKWILREVGCEDRRWRI